MLEICIKIKHQHFVNDLNCYENDSFNDQNIPNIIEHQLRVNYYCLEFAHEKNYSLVAN